MQHVSGSVTRIDSDHHLFPGLRKFRGFHRNKLTALANEEAAELRGLNVETRSCSSRSGVKLTGRVGHVALTLTYFTGC